MRRCAGRCEAFGTVPVPQRACWRTPSPVPRYQVFGRLECSRLHCLFNCSPVPNRANALAHWRAGALAHWRTGALARWRTGALAHWRTGALAHWRTERAGALAHWRAGTLARWHTGTTGPSLMVPAPVPKCPRGPLGPPVPRYQVFGTHCTDFIFYFEI